MFFFYRESELAERLMMMRSPEMCHCHLGDQEALGQVPACPVPDLRRPGGLQKGSTCHPHAPLPVQEQAKTGAPGGMQNEGGKEGDGEEREREKKWA